MVGCVPRVSSRRFRRAVGSSDAVPGLAAIFASACVTLLLCSQAAQAKISAQSVAQLIQSSDEVVIATVTDVSEPESSTGEARLATAEAQRTLKGAPVRTVRFYASSGWICDTSHAVVGETVLLFLNGPTEETFSIALAGRGYMPLRKIDGKDYAALWKDVVLPNDAPVIAGPDPRYDFIVSVELSYLEALIAALETPGPS